MDITFVLCPNIIGLLGVALLLVFIRFNFYLDRKKLKLFMIAAICNATIIIAEVADYMLAEASFDAAYLPRRVTSALGFALTALVPLMIAYIAAEKKLPRWVMVPAAVNVVISFASIFTGHLFYIDEFNSYFRGPLFYLLMVNSVFYLLLLIYVSFSGLKNVRPGEAIFLIGIVGVIFLANLLEIIFSFHFLIWNCCGVLLIAYYLFLHIQYFRYDPLTGAFNRNMFNFDVERISHRTNVCVASFDLNGLKKINDTQGHESGDAYIIQAAKLIGQTFAGAGHLYRIGGDEFVVLLANISEEAVQEKIAQFEKNCAEQAVSVACGYSFMETPADLAQMLRDADNAMYQNKRERTMNR